MKTTYIRRWRQSRWGVSLLLTALIFSLLTMIPLIPWKARCYELPVSGPYRPVFIREVTAWLSLQDVYYWRLDGVILLRILPLFDGNDIFNRGDVLLNINKLTRLLEDDITVDGVLYPKPPALLRVEKEQQERGTYDGYERCRAAIQFSPADPPLP